MNMTQVAVVALTCLLSGVAHPENTNDQYVSFPMTADLKTKIDVILQDHAEVMRSLPNHPLAPEMLEELISLVSAELRLDTDSATRFVVEHFSDSDLGLYALSSRLDASKPQTFPVTDPCVNWCLNHPNTRVACLALDGILSAHSDTFTACGEQIQMHPRTRLAAFAGLRLAERLSAEGDVVRASDALLAVLQNPYSQAVSATAAQRARQIWTAGNQWMPLCIIDSRNDDTFVPPAVLRRLYEHLTALTDPALPNDAPLAAALWNQWPGTQTALESFSIDERLPAVCRVHACLTVAQYYAREGLVQLATAYLERAFDGFTAEPSKFPARVELAFAAYAIDAAPPGQTAQPRGMEQAVAELLLAGRFETARRGFLKAVDVDLQRLPSDDRLYYALRIADRQDKGNDIPAAAETLRAALTIHGGHPALVKRLQNKLARIQLIEYYSRWRPEPVKGGPARKEGEEAP
jgi:hypothetical protein